MVSPAELDRIVAYLTATYEPADEPPNLVPQIATLDLAAVANLRPGERLTASEIREIAIRLTGAGLPVTVNVSVPPTGGRNPMVAAIRSLPTLMPLTKAERLKQRLRAFIEARTAPELTLGTASSLAFELRSSSVVIGNLLQELSQQGYVEAAAIPERHKRLWTVPANAPSYPTPDSRRAELRGIDPRTHGFLDSGAFTSVDSKTNMVRVLTRRHGIPSGQAQAIAGALRELILRDTSEFRRRETAMAGFRDSLAASICQQRREFPDATAAQIVAATAASGGPVNATTLPPPAMFNTPQLATAGIGPLDVSEAYAEMAKRGWVTISDSGEVIRPAVVAAERVTGYLRVG